MNGCSLFGITTPIETFRLLHQDLFPKAQALGIETVSYMKIVFRHPKISKADKDFLKNGIKWLNEEAIAQYKKEYKKLSSKEREAILQTISKTEWGESFLYDVMSYMFEAMLADPIYGGNNKQAGWQWLQFKGGLPRPKEPYLG